MDIQSCCSIAIVVRSALWTSPFTNPQIFDLWILVSANGAELTRWKKLVYFHYLGSHLSAYVFQDALKRGEAIVHNLFSVACLHELHGQIFETDDGIFFAKFFCIRQVFIVKFSYFGFVFYVFCFYFNEFFLYSK